MTSLSGRLLPLLVAVVGGAVTLTPLAVPGATATDPDDERESVPSSETFELRRESPGLQAREVAIGEQRDGRRLRTGEFDLLAATWRGESPGVRVRTRGPGGWHRWRMLHEMEDLPNVTSAERTGRTGTDLVWARSSRAVQVKPIGDRPRSLRLVLFRVDGTSQPAMREALRASARTTNRFRPRIRNRQAWGANNDWRTGRARYNHTIKQVHVHHTVNGNGYTRAQVPGMIRAIYRYHTKSLGWSDIGYNFVVDKFGRAWLGRAGGAKRPVRGAHTLGFNHSSTGVAVLGNFQRTMPTKKAITGVVQLAAWKLRLHGRNPRGRVTVWSKGSPRYPAGTKVRLPTIDGHRDTGHTACPGQLLYDKLPRIRKRAKNRIDRFHG